MIVEFRWQWLVVPIQHLASFVISYHFQMGDFRIHYIFIDNWTNMFWWWRYNWQQYLMNNILLVLLCVPSIYLYLLSLSAVIQSWRWIFCPFTKKWIMSSVQSIVILQINFLCRIILDRIIVRNILDVV